VGRLVDEGACETPRVRFVVVGAGAIGGLVGARLHANGETVLLVARGDHGRAIRDGGLQVETVDATTVVHVPSVEDVRTVEFHDGDAVLLATKSQHTAEVLAALRERAPADTPVVCLQNGVANERTALRHFANVYGVCVMCPATHLRPGVIRAHRAPVAGILDLGRYPGGVDEVAEAIAAAFRASEFAAEARPDIMRWKYGKLVLNLGNAIEAIAGPVARAGPAFGFAWREGKACLAAAGIEVVSPEEEAARRADLVPLATSGEPRGGSSWQSMMRQTGNVEADYLNGEIVLLGRLHGVPTPVNALLQRLANDHARDRIVPDPAAADTLAQLVSEAAGSGEGASGPGPAPQSAGAARP
jgi:2-dehydropantoate 2-reductase